LAGNGFLTLPSWQTACGLPEAVLQTQLASSAAELRQVGVDLVFGPVLDTVATSSAFLAQRSCAASFSAVVKPTKIWVNTFNQAGIGSVIKHYPNLGGLLSDPHKSFDSVATASAAETWFIEQYASLPVAGAMTSHAGQPPDEDIPCSQSARCMKPLTAVPNKLLFSDALEMTSAMHGVADKERTPLEIAIDALIAGNDVIVYGPQQNAFFTRLLDGLEFQYSTQPEFKKIVDDRLIKVLRYKKERQKNWFVRPTSTVPADSAP
jgi:beta-N-acetylhexosaminidase